MAELAEEQRRSASRTAPPLPTRTPGSTLGSEVPAPVGPAAASRTQPSSLAQPVGAAKLEQIKDLYLTAEAIGEDALDKHFDQVSDKQRQLIKEYFDQVVRNSGTQSP